MKNVGTIFKKEMRRMFTDPRMLVALFLPGVLIFLIYTLMSGIMNNAITSSSEVTNTTYKVAYTDNYRLDKEGYPRPQLLAYLDAYIKIEGSKETTNKLEMKEITTNEVEEYTKKVKNGEYTMVLSFSDDFDVNIYDSSKIETTKLTFIFDGSNKISSHFYTLATGCFVPAYSPTYYSLSANNVGSGNYALNSVFGMLVPMLTISLLYSTIISICPETFAGEKERGTLANVLLTPVKRSEVVAGKILALTITAIASGLVSFVGMVSSLPKMFAGTVVTLTPTMIILMLFLIISTLILFVTFGTLISAVSKTSKESTSLMGPLSVIFILLSLMPIILKLSGIQYAFIPVMNVSLCMASIIGGTINPLFFTLTIVANLLFTVLMIFVTTRLFKKEKYII